MASFFANAMPLCAFIWCIAFYCFEYRLSLDWESVNPNNQVFSKATKQILPLISIITGGVLLVLICLFIIFKGTGENDALESE